MNNNQFEQLIRQIKDRVKGGPANEETFDFASIKTNSACRDRRTCIGKMLNALFLPFSLLVFALSALAESGESRHDDAVVSSAGEGVSDRPVELVRPDGSVELFTSRDEAVDAANAAVTHEPWYTPVESGFWGQAPKRLLVNVVIRRFCGDSAFVTVLPRFALLCEIRGLSP